MTTTFKHLVGKSTLKEGITIHKAFESFFETPGSGQKKEITLLYGNEQSVTVVLRRLDNVRKHVQIKYTNKTHAPFVYWLNEVFAETKKGSIGEFIEFQKVAPAVFKLLPLTVDMAHNAKLYVADSMYHKTDQAALKGDATFGEVEKIINGINFKVDEGQSFYNREIERAFSEYEWRREIKAIPELDLTTLGTLILIVHYLFFDQLIHTGEGTVDAGRKEGLGSALDTEQKKKKP